MKGLLEFTEGAAATLLVMLGIAAVVGGLMFLIGLWRASDQARYDAKVQELSKQHQEQIRLNNELMVEESLACARSGGVPVRVDIMNAAPRIHCAR